MKITNKLIYIPFFTLLWISLILFFNFLSLKELGINILLKIVVTEKSCNNGREEMCRLISEFQNADQELPSYIKSTFTLGRLYSAHLNFKQTFEYGRTWSVILIEKKEDVLKLESLIMESESELEIQDSKALISEIESGIPNEKNTTYIFIKELDKTFYRKKCTKYLNSYRCPESRYPYSDVYIRYANGFIYMFALGSVHLIQGSIDTVSGFYISKLPIPQ